MIILSSFHSLLFIFHSMRDSLLECPGQGTCKTKPCICEPRTNMIMRALSVIHPSIPPSLHPSISADKLQQSSLMHDAMTGVFNPLPDNKF